MFLGSGIEGGLQVYLLSRRYFCRLGCFVADGITAVVLRLGIEGVVASRGRHPGGDKVMLQHGHPATGYRTVEGLFRHVGEGNFFVFIFGSINGAAGIARHRTQHAIFFYVAVE